MDQREIHLGPLGICYRLYHFIIKILASQAFKTVTLGGSTNHGSTSTAPRGSVSKGLLGDFISSPSKGIEDKNNPRMKVGEMARENKGTLPQTKSLKKVVSICDNVEEIVPSKKKRSRSFQKSSSVDQEEEKEEDPKPLRSILKVGSYVKDKSNSVG